MKKSILCLGIVLLLPFSIYANTEQIKKLSKEIGENIQVTLEVKRNDTVEKISFTTGSDKFIISHILKTEPPSFISFSGSIKKKKQDSYYLQFKFDIGRPIASGSTTFEGKTIPNVQYRDVSIDSGINFQIGEEIELQKSEEGYIKFSTQNKNAR